MELNAKGAEAYLVGGQLKKEKEKEKEVHETQGKTYQLHIHFRQYTTGVQPYNTGQREQRNLH